MSRLLRLICFAIFCAAGPTGIHAADKGNPPAVVAYVFPQETLLQPGQVNARGLTRINYAFANIKDGRLVAGFPQDPANLAYLNSLRKENPSLTILISVGGWLWSGDFSAMSATAGNRAKFIESALAFLRQYGLDGIDIDWEYPGMPGSGHAFKSEDKQNFTALTAELRAALDQETRKTGQKLYLTIAAGASDEFLQHTEMGKVQHFVDTVNLMAYDYYEPGSSATTGNHAPLYKDPADPVGISADESVRAYEAAGVPAEKIVLGVPWYGHAWGNVANVKHGLFQKGKPVPDLPSSFGDIQKSMLGHGFTRYWDASASVPYLYSPTRQIFVSYEDEQSIALKSRYVLDHHLAGVMFWDYASDPTGKLLSAINGALHRKSSGAAEHAAPAQ